MTQSVWPHDHETADSYGVEKPLDELLCFVLCPASPTAYWDEFFELISGVTRRLSESMGVVVNCQRAVDILSAGIIHPEIWRNIRTADLVIADISGTNGNVMLELGVASAWLDKDRVIILREAQSDEKRLFDINPARQIDYTRSPMGFIHLADKLMRLIQEGIARAPFERAPRQELSLPVILDLQDERHCRFLWGPTGAHRRILPSGLEFGSRFNFRYSWISVANVMERNVRVTGEFRFSTPLKSTPYPPWIGVMVRSQGYLANTGHLAFARLNGEVVRTEEREDHHHDVDIGRISAFAPGKPIEFDITIDEAAWSIRMGDVDQRIAIQELPYVFSAGRIIVLGQFCWVCLTKLSVAHARES